ncbi:hypothetical protein EV175_001420 [Coemansia sp. RSA 1933]|nr:hypothetical protein EV175_001420 [Coemansia sp. RSA 1933]
MDGRHKDGDGGENNARMICLDTESSICLAIDKTQHTVDAATQTTPRESQIINSPAMVDKPHRTPKPPATASSDSHFIPRVVEVNGSSDSQQQQQSHRNLNHHKPDENGAAAEKARQRELRNDGTSKSDTLHMGSMDDRNKSKTAKHSGASKGFGDSDTFLHRSLSDTGTDLDRELQAAVDMMLQGSTSIGLAERSYQFGTASRNMRGANLYSDTMSHGSGRDSERVFVPGSMRSAEDAPTSTRMQRIWLGGKQLKQKIADRFARRRDADIDEDDKSLTSIDEAESCKRKHQTEEDNDGAAEDGETKRLKCLECTNPEAAVNAMAISARGTAATTIPMIGASLANNRVIGPMVRYMQRRPLASLGIVLGVLLALLTIIIVILVVGVFPFLMRSTLQDLSLAVTSVRASAPPQVSRALKLTGRSVLAPVPEHRLKHNARLAVEPALDLAAHIGISLQHAGKVLVERDQENHPHMSSAPMSLATHAHASTLAHSVHIANSPLSHPAHVEHVTVAPPAHERLGTNIAHSAGAPSPNRETHHHQMPRVMESHASPPPTPKHIPAPSTTQSASAIARSIVNSANNDPVHLSSLPAESPAPASDSIVAHRAMHTETKTAQVTPSPPPGMIVIPNVVQPTNAPKALDADVTTTSTYMLKISGNMTSGGPIGVDVEFTEPLRLYWGDFEVGSVSSPVSIHVPGRGSFKWSWPEFEVSIPATSGTKSDVIVESVSDHPQPHSLTDKRFFFTHSPDADDDSAQTPRSLVQVGVDKIGNAPSDGAMAAQRRVINGNIALGRSNAEETGNNHVHVAKRATAATEAEGSSSTDLTSWFAAIRDNRPFTMLWRSRVKISAMGLHAKDIKFEKAVRVQCDDSKNCVVADDSPTS